MEQVSAGAEKAEHKPPSLKNKRAYAEASASSAPTGLRMAAGSLASKIHENIRALEAQAGAAQRRGDAEEASSLAAARVVLAKQLAEIREAGNVSARRERWRRFEADVRAGMNPRLAWRKEKSRMRASECRQQTRPERAAERISLGQQWHELHAQEGSGQKQTSYPLMPHLVDEESKPLTVPKSATLGKSKAPRWSPRKGATGRSRLRSRGRSAKGSQTQARRVPRQEAGG